MKLEDNNGFFEKLIKKKNYSDSDENDLINNSSDNSISVYSDINILSNEDNIYSYYILEENFLKDVCLQRKWL